MKHEIQSIPELEKISTPYESRIQRLQRFSSELNSSLSIGNMRWDATHPDLFPPSVFEDIEATEYADTLDGRIAQIARKVSDGFKKTNYFPKPEVAVDGLTDVFTAATQRLDKVFPNHRLEVSRRMTQAATITLRNIQLDQKNTPSSSKEAQLTNAILSDLKEFGPPESPSISSSESGFMNSDLESLSYSFHERIEEALGPENDNDFMYIRKAVRFAEGYHGDQKRFDGTLNRSHILRLGIRLLEDPTFISDPTPLKIKISSALLHDIIEDTDCTLNEIAEEFGYEVMSTVDSLSRVNRSTGETRTDEEYYERIYTQPKYVQEIKGHDRVDNLEALLQLDLKSEDRLEIIEKGIRYLDETHLYYYPLAADCPHLLNKLQKAHSAALEFYPNTTLPRSAWS